MTTPRSKPTLTAADLADDKRLLAIIDAMLTADQTYWRHMRKICKLQLRHQALASEDAFVALLDLEAALTEREAWMLAAAARWLVGCG